jgi:RimJ/RimL family protein N-acetyltransferase
MVAPPERPRDATEIVIRPISPNDKRALSAAFARLGETSRYRRFLSPHTHLSDAELRYLTELDHHDHEALVAIDPRTGQGVGVARYIRSRHDPTSAELAIAVVDDWQRMGVGTRLATALADRARQEGIAVLTALVLADNELVLNLADELGKVRTVHQEHGTAELTVELPEHGPGHLSRLLRTIAADDLRPFPAHRPAD